MRIASLTRWLLVAVFLTDCTGCDAPRAAVTGAEMATATVNPLAVAPSTATAAAQPQLAATPNGGGITNDVPAVPVGLAAAATIAEPPPTATSAPAATAPAATQTPTTTVWSTAPHPLQIEVMRQQTYPGSPIKVEQTLAPGANYSRYIVSYRSDGYKINALMTIPNGPKPASGWPAIVFNHGYIAPAEYRSTERYVAYVDYIARNGYIVVMSDYRGWADSEGGDSVVGGGYGNPALTVDVLNAIALLKTYGDADPNRIGMWGHSMGGQLTLRAMVVSKDIRAGVIWGGVVAPYPDVIARWGRLGRSLPATPARPVSSDVAWIRDFGTWVQDFRSEYGASDQNPGFWATISPNTYLADLSGPLQLHHSTTDEMVPLAWSQTLDQELKDVNKQPHEFYTYPGDNHNISANFGVAMQRTVAFFDKYVKGQ